MRLWMVKENVEVGKDTPKVFSITGEVEVPGIEAGTEEIMEGMRGAGPYTVKSPDQRQKRF